MTLESVLMGMALGAFIALALIIVLDRFIRSRRVAQLITSAGVPGGVNSILDELDAAVIVLDEQREVVLASGRARDLGLVGAGGDVSTLIASTMPSRRSKGFSRNLAVSSDLAFTLSDGSERSLRLHFAPIGSQFLVMLATDITEEQRAELIRRDFVANISHELKTPTASIALISEAIAVAADKPDEVRRFQSRLSDEVQRLSAITNDIIELSRLQSEKTQLAAQRVDLSEIVRTTFNAHQTLAEGVGVKLELAASKPAVVRGDERALRIIVENLLSNAILYSNDGGVARVEVTAGKKWVSLSVSDTGVGIPADELDRVWERFYRVDPARSRNTGGSGLGLSIVKHAVRRHGGKVKVESMPGRGSTFTVEFPSAKEES